MFGAYLEERTRARLVSARVMHSVVTCTALTFGACVFAHVAHRLSVESLGGASSPLVLVAPLSIAAAPDELLEQPRVRGPACGGLDRGGDDESVLPPSPTREVANAEPRRRRSRHEAPPKMSVCFFPPPEPDPPVCLPGAPCSAQSVGQPKSPVRSPVVAPPLPPPVSSVPMTPLYTPHPSKKDLQRTFTGRHNRHDGVVGVDFCVDRRGRVSDANVAEAFPDDPQIDRLVLEAVRRWRFRPKRAGTETYSECSTARFEIEFE